MKKFWIIILVIFLYNSNVYAASSCSYKEQTENNQKAANIKAVYEFVTTKYEMAEGDVEVKSFDISILNLTKEFYIIVKNDITSDEFKYTYDDLVDNIIKFRWEETQNVTNFVIEVYTSELTSCPNEKVKTVYLTTPRFNKYSRLDICNQLTDFSLCEEFVNYKPIDDEKFWEQINEYQNKNNVKKDDLEEKKEEEKFTDKIFSIVDDYKWYILSGVATIITFIVIIQINKRKKQRDLGL